MAGQNHRAAVCRFRFHFRGRADCRVGDSDSPPVLRDLRGGFLLAANDNNGSCRGDFPVRGVTLQKEARVVFRAPAWIPKKLKVKAPRDGCVPALEQFVP